MRRRFLPAVVVPALAMVGLTGCTASGTFGANCEPSIPGGAVASSVQLEIDDQGFPTAFVANAPVSEPQRAIMQRGEDRSELSTAGSLVTVNLAAFDSANGELLSATPTFGTDQAGEMLVLNQPDNPLVSGLQCAAPGDTVSMILPAQLSGIPLSGPDSSLVVVAEVKEVRESSATGAIKNLPSGFPAVVTDETGRPGVVLPPQDPPAKSTSAVRVAGDGAVVTAENQVFGQVLTVGWDGVIQQSTWDDIPTNFGPEAAQGMGAVDFREQLTGATVGSQVVVITSDGENPRVSVVDILAVL